MLRKLKKLIISIVFLVIVFIGYRIFTKKSPIDFVKTDTKAIIVMNKMSSKNFKELEPVLKDFMEKKDIEELDKNRKYISKIYIISDNELYEQSIDFVAIIDPGIYYYLAINQWEKYFVKTDGIYKTKEEYKEKVKGILPGADTVYADYKGGLFFVSNKTEYLKKYLAESKEKNKNVETIIKENKSNLYTFIYNNNKTKELGVDFITLTATLKNKEIIQNIKFHLNETIYSFLDYQPSKRRLKNSITNDSVYISMEDFSKLEKVIFNQYGLDTSMGSAFSLGIAFLGVDIKKELQNIDGEMLIDLNNGKISIALKDVEQVKKLYGKLGKLMISNDKIVNIDSDKKILTINLGLDEKNNDGSTQLVKNETYIRKEQFLYAHITPSRVKEINTSEILNLNNNLIKKDIIIKGVNRVIEVETTITKENLLEHINYYREKIKNKK